MYSPFRNNQRLSALLRGAMVIDCDISNFAVTGSPLNRTTPKFVLPV